MEWMELSRIDPNSEYDDLRPLCEMIGDARVVGLGECTHGSSEIHRLKHRIVRLLVEEMGFTAVVFEANLAEVIRVNEYVLEGRGDPSQLLPQYLYAGVCTEETADLLRWMWAHNSTGRKRIALAGCDIQRIDTAAEIVIEYLKTVDRVLASSVAQRYAQVLEADRVHWLSGKGIQAWFPVTQARGRRIRFSGFIRTEDVTNHACIWGWAGGAGGAITHDALEGRRPRGTSGWREYAIELDVPKSAAHVGLGCYLAGNGRAWFHSLAIEIDGETWQDPDRIDLDFSSEDLTGFFVDPRNRATLDEEVTRLRRPSLRIEPAAPVPGFEMSDVRALAVAEEVLSELTERLSGKDAAKALRCARAVVQTMHMRTGGGDAARARLKAENIEWLLSRDEETRVVFWAHNGHVARNGGDTGSFLSQSIGDRYLPMGFATGEGKCLALTTRWREGARNHYLAPPPTGSIERCLADTGWPLQILDLRTAEADDPDWGWLTERRPFRNFGAAGLPYEFFEQRVPDDFDLLCWVERTGSAQALSRSRS